MCKRILAGLSIIALAYPPVALAQLSSENYVVEGASISAPNTTAAGTSTNFQTEQESGGLYIYDEPVATPVSSGGGRSEGTKINRALENPDSTPSEQVLGKLDSITICHSGSGGKYVALTNVQVFVTLAENGLQAELRGHDGHDFDIVPSFLYDVGDGVKRYPGKNWTVENQILYANNCALFLVDGDSESTQPSLPPAEPEPEPMPSLQVPVDVCRTESSEVEVNAAIDEQTTVRFSLPSGIARSRIIEETKDDYRLLVQVKPVSTSRAQAKERQIVNALKVLERRAESGQGNTEPPGLIKKVTIEDVYIPPRPTFETPTPSGGMGVLTVGNPDCAGEESSFPVSDGSESDESGAEFYTNDEDGDGLENDVDPDDNNDGRPDDPRQAIITAHMIECDAESLLPNWGHRGGPNLTRSSAQTWVANTPGCRFVPGWSFEWGTQSARNPGDNLIGSGGTGWTTFGPTDMNGMAYTTITDDEIETNRHFWVRYTPQSGYIGFTHRYDRSSYSAEMYCHRDVLNYDNYDRIDGIKTNDSFNCIGWVVAGETPLSDDGVVPLPDSDSDGVPDVVDELPGLPDVDTDGDGLPDSNDPDQKIPNEDSDGDGLPNIVDEDDDNDGILDSDTAVEGDTTDTDNDGVPDAIDIDDDNDGIADTDDSEPLNTGANSGDGAENGTAEDFTEELVFLVEDAASEFTVDDLTTVIEGNLMTPIEISVVDETGAPIDSFERPISVDIFNPNFVDAEDIVVLQPSANEDEWFVVPFDWNDDTVTVQLLHPGEIFIWIKPKTALASELDSPGFGLFAFPRTIPVSDAWLNLLQLLGLFSGFVLTFLQMAAHPFSFTNIGRFLNQAWHNFFAFITFRKKKRPWGVVYDSETKFPLDPALVEVFDAQSKKVDEAITDLDGRYGFVLPVGNYSLQVKKTNYTFPSQKVAHSTHDVVYHNLYHGGPVVVSDSLVNDIPMDPVNFDWNQYEKLRTGQTRFFKRFDRFFVRVLDVLHIVGAILMMWQFVSIPTILSGFLLFLYAALLWNRYHAKTPLLYGFIEENTLPIPYALVQVYVGDQEILRRVADEFGRYFALVSPGTYTVKVSVPQGDNHYEQVFTKRVKARDGIINSTLVV